MNQENRIDVFDLSPNKSKQKLDEGYQRSTINHKICCSLNYNLNNKNLKIISNVNDFARYSPHYD